MLTPKGGSGSPGSPRTFRTAGLRSWRVRRVAGKSYSALRLHGHLVFHKGGVTGDALGMRKRHSSHPREIRSGRRVSQTVTLNSERTRS